MSQVRAVIKELEKVTEKVIARLSVNIHGELVETTPVDTGWARANWVPAIGSPRAGSSASQPPPGGVAAVGAQAAAGVSALTGYKLSQGNVFISNNVPYINRLNDGYSKQAPRGFVQAAIRRGVSKTEASF